MIKVENISVVFMLMFFVLSCAASSSTFSNGGPTPRYYKKEYDTVFDKAVEACVHLGWALSYANKDSGIISATGASGRFPKGFNFSAKITKDKNRIRVDASCSGNIEIVGGHSGVIKHYFNTLDNLFN